MAGQTQTRRILVKVDTSGDKALRDVADKLGVLNRNTKSLAGNMQFLTSAFTSWLGYLGVRELTQMADQMQNLSSRLKITAQEGENTAETMRKIAELADRTNQSIGSVSEVYNRLAVSLSKANPRAEELVALSEVLINTFRVAGATASETSNTITQLSQAFTSGELRGQELRSVMEQNGVLARLLNEEFGKQGNIYKAAEKGQIRVTDVLRLLGKEQEKIRLQAEKLAPTFEQTLTKAMNKLSIQVGALNEQFGLSTKFAAAMGWAIENLANILAVATPILVAWSFTYIPSLVAGFQKLRVAAIAFAASNPILLALTAISVVAVLVYQNFDKLNIIFKKLQANAYDFLASIEEMFNKGFSKAFGEDSALSKRTAQRAAELRKAAQGMRDEVKKLEASAAKSDTSTAGSGNASKDLQALIDKMQKMDKPAQKVKKVKEELAELNKALQNGAISIEEYNSKLVNFEIYKLNREFSEGKFDIFTYNQRLKELNIQEFNRQLKNGVITLAQFQDQVRKGNIDELNAKFQAGKIGLIEYNQELIKMSDQFLPGSALIVGTSAYIESIGTLSDNIAKGITATFGHLEDNLVEFVKTGKFNFAQFTQAVLDDLTKIIIRASIIKPLANALLGGLTGGAGAGYGAGSTDLGGDYSSYAAKGMAFDTGGVKKFAAGGIVSSPTMFRYGGNRTGLMGEAGPEAIMPLSRGSNGKLGVQASITPVTVNIINQSGATVDQRESTGPSGEKTIDILIHQKVREGITTGKYDAPMKQAFGVGRKGS